MRVALVIAVGSLGGAWIGAHFAGMRIKSHFGERLEAGKVDRNILQSKNRLHG